MQTQKKQRGVATVLMVILISLSVMLITAIVARSMLTKKEGSVAAHAQTNAQLMAWAGVSAFQQYVLTLGQVNIEGITNLSGRSVNLRVDANQKKIVARNVMVNGCTTSTGICQVSADISAENMTSQAGTTVNVVFNITTVNGSLTVASQKTTLNFGGNTAFTGSTLITSEVPNSEVTINSGGDLTLNIGFKTQNISKLNINATGDVYIDCGASDCGDAIINISAKGNVNVLTGDNFGDIEALGWVTLQTDATAKNITSIGDVRLINGNANDIRTLGAAKLTFGSNVKSIYAAKEILLSSSNVNGDVKTLDYVQLDTNALVKGSVYAKGNNKFSTSNGVSHSASTINGSVYANEDIRIWGGGKILGKVYVIGEAKGFQSVMEGGVSEHNTSLAQLDFGTNFPFDEAAFRKKLGDNTTFMNKVDVTVYKSEANYIFTMDNGIARVFLNQVKNNTNTKTYIQENKTQYQLLSDGTRTLINSTGFAIGDYDLGGTKYTGAICLTVDNKNRCSSEIIGYLPRVSMGWTSGITDDYGFGSVSKKWRLRSLKNPSSIDNATLAPGIMYFEGELEFAGEANWSADATTNAFTNTFLAEGTITAIAFSTRIYSPYSVIREGSDKVAVICSRLLKNVNGNLVNTPATTPQTLSNRYLIPLNLCKSDTEFSKNMHKNADGTNKKVTIDGTAVDKLDLGTVALMSNNEVNIGSCAQIYGDVLARKEVNVSAACGITNSGNAVVGHITVQGTDKPHNDFLGGTKLVVSGDIGNSGSPTTSTGLKATSISMAWAKTL